MGKGLIILAVGALLFAQCSGDKTSTVDDSIGYIFEKQEELSFEELEYPDLLGVTMQLIKQDSLLFLNDYHGDSLIHVYNLNTRQIVRKLILAGNGPNELIPPLELQLVDDNLWILSRPLHVLTHIPCRSIGRESCFAERRWSTGRGGLFCSLGRCVYGVFRFLGEKVCLSEQDEWQ